MNKKIEKLTKEQESRFQEFVDKWIAIGTDTSPCNHALAEDALNRSYTIVGLNPPKKIIWTTSPLAGVILVSIFSDQKLIEEFCSSENILKKPVWNSVRNSVGNSVWNSVRNSVRNSVLNSVGNSVGNSVRNSVRNSVWNAIFGQQDAYFLAFYEYFREVLDLTKQTDMMVPLMDLAKHSNWVFPYENIAIMSEKPIICSLNKDKVIHSETGPAIAYSDGFEIYAVNGKVITKEEFKKVGFNSEFHKLVIE